MRRNDIVYEKEGTGYWAPYGRIWKKAGPDHFVVIFLTKDIITYHKDQLVKVDYIGRWENKHSMVSDRVGEYLYKKFGYDWQKQDKYFDAETKEYKKTFLYMLPLRTMKQRAACYNKVWRK